MIRVWLDGDRLIVAHRYGGCYGVVTVGNTGIDADEELSELPPGAVELVAVDVPPKPGNRPSVVRAAVRAATPADGSTITRGLLIAAVRAACPDAADNTIRAAINDMATDGELERAGYGIYRRDRLCWPDE